MRKRHPNRAWVLLVAGLLSGAPGVVRGQDSGQDSGQQPAAPVPAFGQDNPPAPVAENPPISAIDQPGLEPHAAPLSYLQLGAHISESADSNVAGVLGSGNEVRSVTHALGSLELQRLWSNYDLALDYVGGVGYYNVAGLGFEQLHQLSVDQRVNWKRGQLAVRDAFSYLPEGNFAGGYGSLSTTGRALGGFGENGFYGGSILGTLGQVPRIMNFTLADVTENLTPKSSVTASGGYSLVHYTGNNPEVQGISFIGNSEVSAQAGYDRLLGRHDQMAFTYGYQGFNFSLPGLSNSGSPITLSTAFHTHVVQLMWGHRISGRMDFVAGAGPQFTAINTQAQVCSVLGIPVNVLPRDCVSPGILNTVPEKSNRLTGAGRVSLRYRFPKTFLELFLERYTSSGSGFLVGANSNVGRVNVTRPLTRVWSVFANAGYASNSRVLPGGGSTARSFSYGFAGMGVHRQLGHDFHVFGSYQFNYLTFDSSFCAVAGTSSCNRISRRQVVRLGLDWTPRPIRLD